VNDDAIGVLPLRVIVPITEWKDRFSIAPWIVRLEPDSKNGLSKVSAVDTFQVRSVSQERFVQQLGTVEESFLKKIENALAIVLHIE